MSDTRIPADKSSPFTSWAIPELKKGQVVQAEKLANRGPRGELIDLRADEVIYSSITAAQLEEISQAAYEDVRESAQKEGFQAGHQEGYQQGLAAAQAETTQTLAQLNGVIAELVKTLGEQDDTVEQALVNLATTIASAVLRRDLSLDGSQIQSVVHDALRSLPTGARNIRIFLSYDDYKRVSQSETASEEWQLKVDSNLSPGGCRVETEQSVVDFTLEDQFQQVVNQLVEKRFAQLSGKEGGADRQFEAKPSEAKASEAKPSETVAANPESSAAEAGTHGSGGEKP